MNSEDGEENEANKGKRLKEQLNVMQLNTPPPKLRGEMILKSDYMNEQGLENVEE